MKWYQLAQTNPRPDDDGDDNDGYTPKRAACLLSLGKGEGLSHIVHAHRQTRQVDRLEGEQPRPSNDGAVDY